MKRNIVLIGFSGCGKSTFAPVLAEKLGLTSVDTDICIANRAGMSVGDIFSAKGEPFFRQMETEEAFRCAGLSGAVISTGGGMVLREENMKALSETGLVVFLDRSPSDIVGENLSDRPLLASDQQKIFRLYGERIGLYRKYADITVRNSGPVEQVAEELFHRVTETFRQEKLMLGVIGDPIAHTLSPLIQNTIAEKLGIPIEYGVYHVPLSTLPDFVAVAKEKLRGFNITIPHKQNILPYLDGTDDYAASCGAVNTVRIKDGKLYGYNTDGDGLRMAMAMNGIRMENTSVLLLGAGGAALSICRKALDLGSSVTVLCRSPEKADAFRKAGASVDRMTDEKMRTCARSAGVIVNATPLGMEGIADDFEDFAFLDDISAAVVDIVYKPAETTLLKECRKRGLNCMNGLGMLVCQAVYAFAVFSGAEFDLEAMAAHVMETVSNAIYKEN